MLRIQMAVLEYTLAGLFILIFVFAVIFFDKLWTLDPEDAGVYIPQEFGKCTNSSGRCIEQGTHSRTFVCEPNPNTGFGCIDDNGLQTFLPKTETEGCTIACRSSDFEVVGRGRCDSFDHSVVGDVQRFVSINQVPNFPQPQPTREGGDESYSLITRMCVFRDDTGPNNCIFTRPDTRESVTLNVGESYSVFERCVPTRTILP